MGSARILVRQTRKPDYALAPGLAARAVSTELEAKNCY